ncbi:MAG: hypothetical protein FRX49_00266 [Trebouxia sp. A1-2]|nr:MAG: hypothetical protein FRX49_00266 [Trebouxia sp. A1-2]
MEEVAALLAAAALDRRLASKSLSLPCRDMTLLCQQSLHRSGALGGVPLAHGSHQINGIWASIGYQPLQRVGDCQRHTSELPGNNGRKDYQMEDVCFMTMLQKQYEPAFAYSTLKDLMAPASDAGFWHQLGSVLHQLVQIAIL